MQERRTYPRFNCPVNMFCGFRFEEEKDFAGNIINISREGMVFSLAKSLESDSVIDLSLSYPDIKRLIPLRLKIVWMHSGGALNTYGAKFVDIQSEDKTDLLSLFYKNWTEKVLSDPKAV